MAQQESDSPHDLLITHVNPELFSTLVIKPDTDPSPIAVKKNIWTASSIISRPTELLLPTTDVEAKKAVIYSDMVSEHDSNFFVAHIESKQIPLHPETQDVLKIWLKDENNHFDGFATLNRAVFGLSEADISKSKAQKPNFQPIDHLMSDEFSVLLIAAYDEICTIKGTVEDMPMYKEFGPQFEAFIRNLISDEAWHYSKFIRLIRRYHGHRAQEIPNAVQRIRNVEKEGFHYENTFVLNNEESLYTDEVLNNAAASLVRNLVTPV